MLALVEEEDRLEILMGDSQASMVDAAAINAPQSQSLLESQQPHRGSQRLQGVNHARAPLGTVNVNSGAVGRSVIVTLLSSKYCILYCTLNIDYLCKIFLKSNTGCTI